jgi:3',5'-cyclic AMP phosphodiesterase CpdA
MDAAELKAVLYDEGADLVLHGHNHEAMFTRFDSAHGPVNIIAVPSASSAKRGGKPPAAWNMYQVHRREGAWTCNVTERSYDGASGKLATTREFKLDIATEQVPAK